MTVYLVSPKKCLCITVLLIIVWVPKELHYVSKFVLKWGKMFNSVRRHFEKQPSNKPLRTLPKRFCYGYR